LHAFVKQLMGVPCHTCACIQTCDMEVCFKTNQVAKEGPVAIYTKSQQIDYKDLPLAHFLITDITEKLYVCRNFTSHILPAIRYLITSNVRFGTVFIYPVTF